MKELHINRHTISMLGAVDFAIKPKDRDRYGWDANPFVWKIEFELVEIEKGE